MAQRDTIKAQIITNRAMGDAWTAAINAIAELDALALGRNIDESDREVIRNGIQRLMQILEVK